MMTALSRKLGLILLIGGKLLLFESFGSALVSTERPASLVQCSKGHCKHPFASGGTAMLQQKTKPAQPWSVGMQPPLFDPAEFSRQNLRNAEAHELEATYAATFKMKREKRSTDANLAKLQKHFQHVLPQGDAPMHGKMTHNHDNGLKKLKRNPSTQEVTNKLEWHTQWDHDCSSSSGTAAAGPIPRIFHSIFFQEREAWINWTYPFSLISSDSPVYKKLNLVEQLAIENTRHTLAMNDFLSVHFLDTAACESACAKIGDWFLQSFRREADLRFKADVCRVAALYSEGGYYFDEDMLSYQSVLPLIQNDTEFATAISVVPRVFFQSFIAATPCHPVLQRSAELIADARKNPPPKDLFDYLEHNDWLLGPVTLWLAHGELQPRNTQLFHEVGYQPVAALRNYEAHADANGHECGFVVYENITKKVVFCSRF